VKRRLLAVVVLSAAAGWVVGLAVRAWVTR
jgi:hypothetical protein